MTLDLDNASEPTSRTTNEGAQLLLVSGGTSPHKLAGSVIKHLRLSPEIQVRAIGAGAVNQAAKGCAIARKLGSMEGLELLCALEFATLKIKDEELSAMVFVMRSSPQG